MPDELRREFLRFAAAVRRREAMLWSIAGASAALAGGLIAAVAARLAPLWELSAVLLGLLWGVTLSSVGGWLLGFVWPRPWPRLVRSFDRQMSLADRCTTAWELAQGQIHAAPEIATAQIQDTVAALRRRAPQEAYPLRLPRAVRIALPLLLLLLIPALALPNPQREALARKRAQQQATKAAVAQLTELQAELAQDPTLDESQREAAIRALNAALAALQDRHLTPDERQAALGQAERQLAELRTPADAARVRQIASAAPLSTGEIVAPFSEALARGDLQAAADYLKQFAGAQGTPLTAEQALALADAFNQMADSLQAQDAELAAQFRSIAQEIYTGDAQGARDALQQASTTLAQAAQADASNQTLDQLQAQLQQAQQQLNGGQTAQTAASAQPGASGQPQAGQGNGAQGQGNGMQGGAGQQNGEGSSAGGSGHHEDAGSSAALGDSEAARLAEQGGSLAIPRSMLPDGTPQKQIGAPGSPRVPYRAVYADYSQAAQAELSRRAYPPAMRSYVQQYFSGLEP